MVNETESYPGTLEVVHSNQLLKGLNQLRQRRELCDVELCAGDNRVSAHRVVLSACSPYFNAMFTGKLLESQKQVIHLKEVDENALHVLVDFAYTGKARVTQENVQLLLPAANMLQLSRVKEICCHFLIQQLHPSNCLGVTKFAETYCCQTLQTKSIKYIQDHFQEVIKHEEFFLLPPSRLIELLQDDDLNVISEKVVFDALLSWTRYQLPERIPLLGNLLNYVRLPLLTVRFLTQIYETNELIRGDRTSQVLLSEALKCKLVLEKRVACEKTVYPRRAPKRIFALGGKNGLFATLSSVEYYEPEREKWIEVASMNFRRFEFGAAVLDGKLYAVGGLVCGIGVHSGAPFRYCDNGSECFDPETGHWTRVTSMNQSRSNHTVQPLGGYGPSYLRTVERYDPSTNSWEMMPAMSTYRINFGGDVLNGCLYVVGGHNGVFHLRSVERFDPVASEWAMVTPMNRPRTGLSVTVLNGLLYAVGGHDGAGYLNLVQSYDPQTNKWQNMKNMCSSRCSFGIAAL
ncbi:kelch-like protein 28 isoform X2 [Acropora muricata]|uniref:kelch-like protein 28 isoform X2 n=1 Tax=Acropora millepora TaxID=45264 RepID=UPI0010FCAA44|nr:kelch-like protein 28 isoform X2 [Acropora millepora]